MTGIITLLGWCIILVGAVMFRRRRDVCVFSWHSPSVRCAWVRFGCRLGTRHCAYYPREGVAVVVENKTEERVVGVVHGDWEGAQDEAQLLELRLELRRRYFEEVIIYIICFYIL